MDIYVELLEPKGSARFFFPFLACICSWKIFEKFLWCDENSRDGVSELLGEITEASSYIVSKSA